jgi:RNase P subunit RPR2
MSDDYRIRLIEDPDDVDARRALAGMLAAERKNVFSCSKCSRFVVVSDKKAKKLKKQKHPKVICKECKKIRKARMK